MVVTTAVGMPAIMIVVEDVTPPSPTAAASGHAASGPTTSRFTLAANGSVRWSRFGRWNDRPSTTSMHGIAASASVSTVSRIATGNPMSPTFTSNPSRAA